MEITVKRTYNCKTYCISHVYADGKYVCDAIEDVDRGLDDSMSVEQIKKKKVYAQTAIPTGTYKLSIDIQSPKFSLKPYYKTYCNGKVPRVLNVKGFEGILLHKGKNERSSAGCLILGYNTIKGRVTNSQQAFEKLYGILKEARKKGETLSITYSRTYKI